jgi:hypothetical protein
MHVAAETAMQAVARRLAQHIGGPYGDLVMGPNRAALIAVDEAAPIIRDAVRAMVAEEIALAIEATKPSVNHFWDTADAARVYALNDAAKLARKHAAAPAVRPVEPSAVPAEGSGHPQPADCDRGVAGDWCARPVGHSGPCNATRPLPRRPVLSLDTPEGATDPSGCDK